MSKAIAGEANDFISLYPIILLVSIFKYLFLLLVFIFNAHFTFVLWIEGMQGGKVRAFPQEPGWAPSLLVRVVVAPDLAEHSDWDDTWGDYLVEELRYQTSFLFTQLKYIFFLEEYSFFWGIHKLVFLFHVVSEASLANVSPDLLYSLMVLM